MFGWYICQIYMYNMVVFRGLYTIPNYGSYITYTWQIMCSASQHRGNNTQHNTCTCTSIHTQNIHIYVYIYKYIYI